MSKTMSNPNDWSHFYNHHHAFSSSSAADAASSSHSALSSDATFVTTTAADVPTPIQFIGSRSGGTHNSSSNLNPEGGRVSKPPRKRSRASRRTPTTLLNTDTSNFRAMVQQFTGGPAGPFVTAGRGSPSLNVPGFSYGLLNPQAAAVPGHQQQLANQIIGNQTMPPAAGFPHLQYQQQFQSQSPFMFSLGHNSSNRDGPINVVDGVNSNSSSDGRILLQPGMVNEGRGEVAAGTQIGGAQPSTTSGSNENRGGGFLY